MTSRPTPASQATGLARRRLQPLDQKTARRRERLMAAMVQTAAEKGLEKTTVASVCRRSGVSVGTYRGEFSTLEDCLVATFDSHVQRASARMISSYRAPAPKTPASPDRLEMALGTLMHLIVTGQAAAKLCIVEMRGASPSAVASHERAMWYLAELLAEARPNIKADLELARALAGGIWQVIHNRLVRERADDLPALVADLSLWIAHYTDPYPQFHAKASPPHTSTRSFDHENLRNRLLHATATLIYSHSYSSVTTQAVASQAGCSPSTFYRYFSTKQEAALTVYDRWITDKLAHNTSGDSFDLANIRALPRSMADSLTDDPAAAHLAIIDVFALGRAGRERHLQTLLAIENVVREAVSDDLVPNIAIEATVGALWEALYSHTLNRSHTPDLAAKLTFLLLTPFMGAERASLLARDA